MENNEMTSTRDELLAAWEREFPTGAANAADNTDPDTWVDRPPPPLAPRPYADVVGLTRGEHERQRVQRARRWVEQTQIHGGDHDGALRELHAASNQLVELERTGQAEQYIELDRGPARTIHGPAVVSTWRPIR